MYDCAGKDQVHEACGQKTSTTAELKFSQEEQLQNRNLKQQFGMNSLNIHPTNRELLTLFRRLQVRMRFREKELAKAV